MASWKYRLFIGIIGISLLTAPAWSQEQAPPAAPAPGSDAKSYVELGGADGAKGNLAAAVAAFNQAISIDPKYAPAYFNRGLAYTLQNKPDEAVSDYSQAIQIDPTYKEAYYQRGCLKGQKGDFDEAISDFSEAIKLDPKYGQAYYQSGHVKYFKGDLDGALDELNQSLSLNPNFSVCYFIRGLIRHAQGHREEATLDFQKSFGLGFPNAAFWVWISEMENGQPVLARKDLLDAMGKSNLFKPDDWPSQVGNFLLEKNTRTELMAKAKTDSASETSDHLCEAWFYSGMHDRLSGGSKEAQECFAQAIATGSKGSEEFIEAGREAAQPQTPQPPQSPQPPQTSQSPQPPQSPQTP
jgi:lipoprotein NlpI